MQKRAAGSFYLPYSFMGNSCNFFTLQLYYDDIVFAEYDHF